MRYTAKLVNPQQGHVALTALWPQCKALLVAGHTLHVTVKTDTRSLAQNARMWAMLTDVSKQVVWHGQKLAPEDWKTIFSAALKKQRVLPGIDGGFVVMGDRTSQMTVGEMSDLMELMSAFAAERDVIFHDKEPA